MRKGLDFTRSRSSYITLRPVNLPFFLSVTSTGSASGFPMNQISIKTPNPKCRLYWCLLDLIDWRYSQSCWYFRPALWSMAPLTFFLVYSVYGVMGGEWPQTDKHMCRQVPFTGQFLSRHLGFGVFIYIWSLGIPNSTDRKWQIKWVKNIGCLVQVSSGLKKGAILQPSALRGQLTFFLDLLLIKQLFMFNEKIKICILLLSNFLHLFDGTIPRP